MCMHIPCLKDPIITLIRVFILHKSVGKVIMLFYTTGVSSRHYSNNVQHKGYGHFLYSLSAAQCCYGRDFPGAHVPAGH